MIRRSRNYRFAGGLVLVLATLFAMSSSVLAQITIMPLGNSITWGVENGTPSSLDTGYRDDLATLFANEPIAVDFVGSQTAGVGFDNQHEGHPGFRADQILANINSYLTANPQVVILHIGTNDVSNGDTATGTRDEISSILDAIAANNSSTKIILSSIIPRTDGFDSATSQLNDLIEELFYVKRDQQGMNLFYAGVNEIFKQDPNWSANYFNPGDTVHPNDAGYHLMAEIYFNVITTALNTASTNISDNFSRKNIGFTWDADPEFQIQSGDLANTATTGGSNWQHMATFLGVENPSSVAVKWAADADVAGLDEGGLALLLDSPSRNASGYLAWISPSNNELHLWTILNGATNSDLLTQNPISSAAAPGPGSVVRIEPKISPSALQFDYFVDSAFAGTVSTPNPGVAAKVYSGVILRQNRNNDIDEFTVLKASDMTPPAAVTDLAAGTPGATSVSLTWTATGDDSLTGAASAYDLRYSQSPIDAGNFSSAIQVPNVPLPSVSGGSESATVTGLQPGVQYYFSLVVKDEAGNTSGLSNPLSTITASGNFFVDNFDRASGLGPNWSADPAYDIVGNQLSNTSTDGLWDDIAVLNVRRNAKEVSFKFSDTADAAGMDQAGFVFVFGAPSATANGYAITRRTAVNEIRLWSLSGGAVSSVIDKNQSPLLAPPAPGDVIKVQVVQSGTSNRFDFYINGQFDGSVEDTGLTFNMADDDWAGVTLRSNLANDIDDFSELLELGAPANMMMVAGDAQVDTVSRVLKTPVTVRVTDANDNPLKDINVDFAITAGNGSVDVSSATGDIVVEAESGALTAPMVKGQDAAASNGEFIQVPDGTGDNPKGLAEYQVTIDTPGDYVIWGRAIYPNGNSDAFRIIVGGVSYLWDIGQRVNQSSWHWDAVSARGNGTAKRPQFDPLVLTLPAGVNSIKVEHSKDGAQLDQFVLTPVGSGFSPPANQDPVAPSGRLTNANGEASANWTLGTLAGANSLLVSTAGVTPVNFSATGLPDSVSSIAKIFGDGQNGAPGQPLPDALVVELRDKWDNLAAGAPLSFSLKPPANGSLTVTSANAGSDGRANTVLTMSTNTAVNEVLVSAPGYVGPEVVFTATAQAGPPTTIAAAGGDGQTASAGQPLSQPLQALVTDKNGIPVDSVDVTFSVVQGNGSFPAGSAQTVKTDASGLAQITPTLGPAAGVENRFTAAVTGLSGSPVTFSANSAPPDTLLSISSLAPDGLTNLPLADSVTVKVVDALGAPVAGQMVGFAISTGDGFVNGTTVVSEPTNAQGLARVEWRMGPNTGAQKLLASSTHNGSGLTNSPIEFVANVTRGPARALALVSGADQVGLVNQPLAAPLVVRVEDKSGKAVRNWPVAFQVTQGGGSLSIESTFTDASGEARTLWTLGPDVGSQNNEARVSAPQTSDIVFKASGVTTAATTLILTSGGGQPPSPAGQSLPERIQVKVTDAGGDPVEGLSVTFRIKDGGGAIDGAAASDTNKVVVSNSAGLADVEWRLGGVLGADNQALEIIARNGIGDLDGSPMTVFATATPGPVDADLSTVEIDQDTLKADGKDKGAITVTLKDAFGNAVGGIDVVLSASANNILEQPSAPTDANGQAFGAVSSDEAGTSIISASVTGGPELNNTATVEFEDVTSVALSTFDAQFAGFDGVLIRWTTAKETSNSGFNVLRSQSRNGNFSRVNTDLIAANTNGSYTFSDKNVEAGTTYYYMLEDVSVAGLRTKHGPVAVFADVPRTFSLSQNYPNPFNPETKIRYELPKAGQVDIRIFDVLGRQVRRLVSGDKTAGFHVATWDARDDSGRRVSSGIFFYQIVSGDFRQTKRMLLMK